MTKTRYGWLKVGDCVLTYKGKPWSSKQIIIFHVKERIHEREKGRIL